jgi:hypothetical protein
MSGIAKQAQRFLLQGNTNLTQGWERRFILAPLSTVHPFGCRGAQTDLRAVSFEMPRSSVLVRPSVRDASDDLFSKLRRESAQRHARS